VSRRYEHASAVLTSNQPFEDLGDGVMAAVLIDRLLHHCLIVNSRGSSFGMREHRALASRLVTPPIAAASPPDRPPRAPRGLMALGAYFGDSDQSFRPKSISRFGPCRSPGSVDVDQG